MPRREPEIGEALTGVGPEMGLYVLGWVAGYHIGSRPTADLQDVPIAGVEAAGRSAIRVGRPVDRGTRSPLGHSSAGGAWPAWHRSVEA